MMLTAMLHSEPTLTQIGVLILLVLLALAALAMFRPSGPRSESLEAVDREPFEEWRP